MQLSTLKNEIRARRDDRARDAKAKLAAIRLNSSKAGLAAARELLRGDKRSVYRCAQDIGLSYGTVANIVDNVTEHPRFSTLLAVFEYYNMKLMLEDA